MRRLIAFAAVAALFALSCPSADAGCYSSKGARGSSCYSSQATASAYTFAAAPIYAAPARGKYKEVHKVKSRGNAAVGLSPVGAFTPLPATAVPIFSAPACATGNCPTMPSPQGLSIGVPMSFTIYASPPAVAFKIVEPECDEE